MGPFQQLASDDMLEIEHSYWIRMHFRTISLPVIPIYQL